MSERSVIVGPPGSAQALYDAVNRLTADRDSLRASLSTAQRELAEARAEVERLTKERDAYKTAVADKLHLDMQDIVNGPNSRAAIARDTAEQIAARIESANDSGALGDVPRGWRFAVAADIRSGAWHSTTPPPADEVRAAEQRVVEAVGAWRRGEYREFCDWLKASPAPVENPAMLDERAMVLAFDELDALRTARSRT